MVSDPYLATVFLQPPLIAYTRPQTIKNKLISAKVPPNSRPKREIPAMYKCNHHCDICPYVQTGKSIKATYTKEVVTLWKSFDCKTKNIVYIVGCKKCNNQYINTSIQTYKTIEDRFKHHLSYVVNNTQATGQHFNSQCHNSSHITISFLEKVHQISKLHREQRESHWIEKYNLKYLGMNKKSWTLLANCLWKFLSSSLYLSLNHWISLYLWEIEIELTL